MEKLEIARRQLGVATWLFIENHCAASVHTLACASREILERQCAAASSVSVLDAIAHGSGVTVGDLRKLANQYSKALKHNDPKQKDDELLERFCDQQNDFKIMSKAISF